MQMWAHIGLLYFVKKKIKLFISIVLVLNICPEEIKEFIENENLKAKIFRIQENNSIMCRYFSIGFTDFMLAGKKLTDYRNFFCPYDFKKVIV